MCSVKYDGRMPEPPYQTADEQENDEGADCDQILQKVAEAIRNMPVSLFGEGGTIRVKIDVYNDAVNLLNQYAEGE